MAGQSEAQYAVLDEDTAGSPVVIAAVATKKIRVLAAVLIGAGAVVVSFGSISADPTPVVTGLTGDCTLATSMQLLFGFNPVGWFETVAGEGLVLTLGASVAVGGVIVYTLV